MITNHHRPFLVGGFKKKAFSWDARSRRCRCALVLQKVCQFDGRARRTKSAKNFRRGRKRVMVAAMNAKKMLGGEWTKVKKPFSGRRELFPVLVWK